ncbi:MAG: D-alanyl-D-alanine carboxypeptidase [Bdellovibrionaceae bacterium]|nr:D-alanyl-D-alanine carboxypeptidase [Pseudobdellovibrionaceae bacterium]
MKLKHLLFLSCITSLSVACSKSNKSIYQGLADNEDGVIATGIPDDNSTNEDDTQEPPPTLVLSNELLKAEKDLADKWHKGQLERFSFLIVDANNKNVMRSYKAFQPRRLASVTKIATAISALENVNGSSVSKIQAMLKSSNNGEASRYVRLAAKAIADYIAPSSAYTTAHSCPSTTVLNKELKSAQIMFDWIKSQISVDWADATIRDGAGCDYGNHLNAVQIVKILEFADQQGKAYSGLSFEKLLSISGVDGTWANHNTDQKGLIFAKTGTLNPNANLAGYFYAKRGGVMHKYYFVVFVEKDSGTTASNNARSFIEALLRNWINYYAKQEGDPIAVL